jgi:hypothetical protein
MPARRTARWAVPGAAALVLSCAALAGCGSSGGSSPSAPSSGGSSPSAGKASAHGGRLTGNFCTDFKNIGTHMPIPAAASGNLATMERHDGRYLNQVAAYYSRLAAEAPPQAGQEIRSIASAYQDLGLLHRHQGHTFAQPDRTADRHADQFGRCGPGVQEARHLRDHQVLLISGERLTRVGAQVVAVTLLRCAGASGLTPRARASS